MVELSDTDPTSFSRPGDAVVSHVSLSFVVDFINKILKGTVVLTVKLKKAIDSLILDTSKLAIKSVYISLGEKLDFEFGDEVPNIGRPLIIQLPTSLTQNHEKISITIEYETSPSASGLQWLQPDQTLGKKHPFLFSQFEAIHARSVYPCQDTPSVKFTYDAQVEALSQYTVLMSAIRDPKVERKGTHTVMHRFKQSVPIPSYLLAIAVGSLDHRVISKRCKVWAEPELVDRCANEFAETELMLQKAEEVCGPYVWGDYDLLILPPSFPYGGMENPCLTFVTPTTIAGDRSLADVVVHEITHSWTGNLVTNANFEHFWLNEGFTVFVERKISSKLNAALYPEKEFRDFATLQGLQDLRETVIGHLGENNPLTNLVVNLKGSNPDNAFSSVPYEKGSIFLRYLEDLLGGPETFDPFLRQYIENFKEKSIETKDFKAYLIGYFKDNSKIEEVDWDAWLHTPGMPHIIPRFDTTLLDACTTLAKEWQSPNTALITNESYSAMSPSQKIAFYQLLLEAKLPIDTLINLQNKYLPHETQNSEIRFRWLRLCLKSHWAEKVSDALQFVNEQGRMKFVRPIYRDLYAYPQARERAIENFKENKHLMMHVVSYNVEKDLHLN